MTTRSSNSVRRVYIDIEEREWWEDMGCPKRTPLGPEFDKLVSKYEDLGRNEGFGRLNIISPWGASWYFGDIPDNSDEIADEFEEETI